MRISRLAIVPMVLVTAGCFEGQRTFKVNADGSGTIVDTVKLGEQAKGMLEGMEQMDSSTPAEKKAKKKAKYEATAAALGPGVTFVSVAPTKDGGEVTTYSFKDINTVRAVAMPNPDADSTSKDEPLTFKLAKNAAGNSVLTIVSAPKKAAEPKKEKASPEDTAKEIAMMKGMLGGLKIKSVVEVNGLVKTSSPNVTGSAVTLMAVDFDAIDSASLAKLSAAGGAPTPAQMRGVKGVTMSDDTVTIEFTGKK
jgi:hypothetical protein